MSLEISIYSPETLESCLPLYETDLSTIQEFRKTATACIHKREGRIPIIVGPCSIHDTEQALIYAEKLISLQEEVKETFFLIMRAYVEKSRTALGWKGLAYDPLLNGSLDIARGIYLSRHLFLELTRLGVPIATEFVNPLVGRFLQDLVTWGFIGARTSASQVHREFVSSLAFPVGFKNTIEGYLDIPIDAIAVSRAMHSFLGVNKTGNLSLIQSEGNPNTHLVLRGSYKGSNYDPESILHAFDLQSKHQIDTPILIDCAHGNSNKNPKRQESVFQTVIEQISEENLPILGLMMESYLEEGSQALRDVARPSGTLSVTDPCMGWEKTRELILWGHEHLQKRSLLSIP